MREQLQVVIFGAGQAGRCWRSWLPGNLRLLCFADNNPVIQGTQIDGTAVCSLPDALQKQPDLICIAVLNQEAEQEIISQIRSEGYAGEIALISVWRRQQDLRAATMRLLANEINSRKIPGAIAEFGVYRGAFAAELNRAFPDRRLYLFDTFSGFDTRDLRADEQISAAGQKMFSDTSVEQVLSVLEYPGQAVPVIGHFPESAMEIADQLPAFAFVSIDPDLYESVRAGLAFFYPRLSRGGVLLIHDYNSSQYPGVKEAVQQFCDSHEIFPVPLPDLHGSAVIIRQ